MTTTGPTPEAVEELADIIHNAHLNPDWSLTTVACAVLAAGYVKTHGGTLAGVMRATQREARIEALVEVEEAMGGCICDDHPHAPWCHLGGLNGIRGIEGDR